MMESGQDVYLSAILQRMVSKTQLLSGMRLFGKVCNLMRSFCLYHVNYIAGFLGASGDNERFIKVQRHNEKKASKKNQGTANFSKSADTSKESSKVARKRPTISTAFKVVISNLKKNTTDDAIRGAFGQCGTIKSIKTSRDKSRGSECKGYSHIEFSTKEGMDAALAANFGTRIQGQVVTVSIPGASKSEIQLIDIPAVIASKKGGGDTVLIDSNDSSTRKRSREGGHKEVISKSSGDRVNPRGARGKRNKVQNTEGVAVVK